jgi:hypothetical protein
LNLLNVSAEAAMNENRVMGVREVQNNLRITR